MAHLIPENPDALLRRRATAEALTEVRLPDFRKDARDKGHAGRWATLSQLWPRAAVSLG